MAHKPRPLPLKTPGFYDNYVEVTIDGMPVLLSRGAADWLKQMSEENQQDQIDKAIALWGNQPR